jgi:uncharacterized protein YgiM (DUF1202 family)
MVKHTVLAAVAAAIIAGVAVGSSSPAQSQYCEGTVHGLSRHYNLATGSGFLAVRKRPTSSSRMVHQLFNGDRVEITDRSGNWYFVGGAGFEGWANRKWMWNSCSY